MAKLRLILTTLLKLLGTACEKVLVWFSKILGYSIAPFGKNLTYGNPEASDEEIIEAMKKAHIFDFVMRLPQGLDTEIGSQGVKISEGQRQLMTIARTMISNPPMLILDEATSSVDTLTEQKFRMLLQMMTGRTSFVVLPIA